MKEIEEVKKGIIESLQKIQSLSEATLLYLDDYINRFALWKLGQGDFPKFDYEIELQEIQYYIERQFEMNGFK